MNSSVLRSVRYVALLRRSSRQCAPIVARGWRAATPLVLPRAMSTRADGVVVEEESSMEIPYDNSFGTVRAAATQTR